MEQRERNLGCNPWWGKKDEEKKGEDWRMTLPLPAAGEVDNQLMISLQVTWRREDDQAAQEQTQRFCCFGLF